MSVFGSGGKLVVFLLWREILITTGKKKIQSSVGRKLAVFLLWREIFITTGKKRYITTGKKKDTVICLMGARFWRLRPEKKKIQSSVCWVRGSGNYDRKKKDTVVCLTGCAVVLFFVVAGNFDYDRKKKKIQSSVGGKLAFFLLWREIFIATGKKKRYITTEKKKIQSSVRWVRGSGDYDRKKKDTVVFLTGCAVVLFFVVAGNFDYNRKKKRYSRLLAGNCQFFCRGGKFSLRPEKKKDTLRPEKKKIKSSV